MKTTQNIKQSFSRVKQDIAFLQQEIENMRHTQEKILLFLNELQLRK